MGLTYKEVSEILKIIDATEAQEVVLEIEGTRLVVRRSGYEGYQASTGLRAEPQQAMPRQALVASGHLTGNGTSRPASETALAEGMVQVRSPMVGTFYRRSSPDQAPLVEVGGAVAQGDPLCLIEVMKLYTIVEAPAAGRIELIAVDDGAPVEFDQLLVAIKRN